MILAESGQVGGTCLNAGCIPTKCYCRSAEIMEGIRSLAGQARELVIVTNEIFSDGIQYSPETIQYQAFLGQINQEIAKMAVNVTEVVYGIPLCHKNERKEGQKI